MMYKVTLKECGRETLRWFKYYFMWREDRESHVQRWAAMSTLLPDAFDKRFYFFT